MKNILYNTFIFSPLLQDDGNIRLIMHMPSYNLSVQDATHAQMADIIFFVCQVFTYYFILSDLVHSNNFETAILTARGPPLKEV